MKMPASRPRNRGLPVLVAFVIVAYVGIWQVQFAPGVSVAEESVSEKKHTRTPKRTPSATPTVTPPFAWTPTPTQTPGPPTPTITPGQTSSLQLEGHGSLVPKQCFFAAGIVAGAICPDTFTAALTGPPFGQIYMNFDIDVFPGISAGPGCYRSSGFGSLGASGDMNVGFDGELCVGLYTYSLHGSLNISPANGCQVPQIVMVGTLAVYGSVHSRGPTPRPAPSPINPFPVGGDSSALVSIIGTVGEIGAPCPSP